MTIDELRELLGKLGQRFPGALVEVDSGGGILLTTADSSEWLAEIHDGGNVIFSGGEGEPWSSG